MFRLIGFYDYTVILTYVSLLSALLGMRFASLGQFSGAICCLMLSGLCDAFDGIVARSKKGRTQDEKSFGIQIDSLCDAISFGVFPVVLCYHMGVDSIVGVIILMLYVLCAAIRLAFFNVLEGKRQQQEDGCNKFYRGMPVTTISILLPPIYLLYFPMSAEGFALLLHIVMAVSAFLFVLDFSVKKINWAKILGLGRKS